MITKIIDEEKIQEVKKQIIDKSTFLIVSHVSPDGDALGSSLALASFLKTLGKTVTVVVPNSFPDFLKWLPGAPDVLVYADNVKVVEKLVSDVDVIFALDFNALSRIGNDLGTCVGDSKACKILIDHHLNPTGFPNVSISYPLMSSTSEMIFRVICRMGYFTEMTRECAECIYTGMMTDTGAFTYNSNNSEIYSIISELIKKGIDKDMIYRNVYNNYSADRFRLMGFILSEKMKIYPEIGTALLTLSAAELKKFDFHKGDTEGFVNIPLSIKGVIFSAFIKEDVDKVKLSFRSQGEFDTNEFSSKVFGGGGHLNASGAESYISLQETIKKFENALPLFSEKLKSQL